MDNCLGCNAAISDTDDFCDSCYDEIERHERECEFCCRPLSDHAVNCPENESSYAQLMQKGYC